MDTCFSESIPIERCLTKNASSFACQYCEQIPTNCKICDKCKQLYCYGCMIKFRECKSCLTEFKKFEIPNSNVFNCLKDLKFKCEFPKCEESISYFCYVTHIKFCNYRVIHCKCCKETFAFHDYKKHVVSTKLQNINNSTIISEHNTIPPFLERKFKENIEYYNVSRYEELINKCDALEANIKRAPPSQERKVNIIGGNNHYKINLETNNSSSKLEELCSYKSLIQSDKFGPNSLKHEHHFRKPSNSEKGSSKLSQIEVAGSLPKQRRRKNKKNPKKNMNRTFSVSSQEGDDVLENSFSENLKSGNMNSIIAESFSDTKILVELSEKLKNKEIRLIRINPETQTEDIKSEVIKLKNKLGTFCDLSNEHLLDLYEYLRSNKLDIEYIPEVVAKQKEKAEMKMSGFERILIDATQKANKGRKELELTHLNGFLKSQVFLEFQKQHSKTKKNDQSYFVSCLVHLKVEKDSFMLSGQSDGVINAWKISSAKLNYIFSEHKGLITAISILEKLETGHFCSASEDCSIKIWILSSRNSICTINTNSPITCIEPVFNLKKGIIMLGCLNKIIVCNLVNQKRVHQVLINQNPYRMSTKLNKHSQSISCMLHLSRIPERSLLLVSEYPETTIRLWNFSMTENSCEEEVCMNFIGIKGRITTMIGIGDPQMFATGGSDKMIRVWNINQQTCVYSIADQHTVCINMLIYWKETSNEKTVENLFSGTDDMKLKIFDLEKRKLVKEVKCKEKLWKICHLYDSKKYFMASCDGFTDRIILIERSNSPFE